MSRARISLGSQEQTDLAIFYSGNFLIQLNGVLRNVAAQISPTLAPLTHPHSGGQS